MTTTLPPPAPFLYKGIAPLLALLLLAACGPPPTHPPIDGDNDVLGDNDGDTVHGDNDGDTDGDTDTDHAWQWVEVPGSQCGNGTPAGLGIQKGEDPTKLMLFFAGGGACWDWASCYFFSAAVNIEATFSQQKLDQELVPVRNSGLIDRQSGPFGEANFVYVPYCTADLHSGDAVGSYDGLNPNRRVHHKGAVNVEAYLDYLVERFPAVDEVYVVGISAGGYGAMINHHRLKDAFAPAPVHLLADGSPMVQPREGRWGFWKSAWNMSFPPACDDCDETFPNYAAHVVESSPESRFALLTWDNDETVTIFFAYPLHGLRPAVLELLARVYPDPAGGPSSAFVIEGTDHVALQYFDWLHDRDGLSLRDFVDAWVQGGP